MDKIEIRLLTPADRDIAVEFVENHIANNGTPVSTLMKLPKSIVQASANQMVTSALANDRYCSYLAIDKTTGQVVSCELREICDRWTTAVDVSEDNSSTDQESSRKMRILADFNRIMWSGVTTFMSFPYSGPWLHYILALVKPEYRKMGLHRRMMAMTLERASVEFGCRYAIGMATSYKSQSYCESEGWTTLRWLNFDDYYVMGEKVFHFQDPNQVCVKLMMVDIRDWSEK